MKYLRIMLSDVWRSIRSVCKPVGIVTLAILVYIACLHWITTTAQELHQTVESPEGAAVGISIVVFLALRSWHYSISERMKKS